MEYLKAWLWTQEQLKKKGKPIADEVLIKYVEKLLANTKAFLDTGLVTREKDGNFKLAKLADMQVENRMLKDEVELARELLSNSKASVFSMVLHEYEQKKKDFIERNSKC